MSPAELSAIIKEEAHRAGFDLCGITGTGELKEAGELFTTWLEKGCHGEMEYLTNNSGKRTNPSLLVPEAKTVIVVALNYYSPSGPVRHGDPIISRYASGVDYHIVMKKKLKSMLSAIKSRVPELEGRVFTDSAPLMEKALAIKAGLGRQGKNSLLLTKQGGSFFFLGEIVISLEAEYDTPATGDPCGSCIKCIEACPTRAINPEGYLDAQRCISYLTIEHHGEIPEEFRGKLVNHVFGCDICQDVCPHNNASKPHRVPEFDMDKKRAAMTAEGWDKLTPEQFSDIFHNSAVSRCGYEKFLRNLRFSAQ